MNDLRTRPMTAEQAKLWQRIEEFDFDEGRPARTFAQRLAEENNWSLDFARRVIDEYKRFLFLAVAAGHQVTPSHCVDEAWHLHLNYTRSYWERLCKDVLRQPLHHDPSRGGEAEDRKFADWYGRTQQSYEEFFGHAPPPDIWGSSKSVKWDDDLVGSSHTAQQIGNFRGPRKCAVGLVGALAAGATVLGAILVMAGTGLLVVPIIIMVVAVFVFIGSLSMAGKPTRRLATGQQASGACGAYGGWWWIGACGSHGGGGGGGGSDSTGATSQPAATMPADSGIGGDGGGGSDGGGSGGSSCGGGAGCGGGGGGGGCGGGGCGGS